MFVVFVTAAVNCFVFHTGDPSLVSIETVWGLMLTAIGGGGGGGGGGVELPPPPQLTVTISSKPASTARATSLIARSKVVVRGSCAIIEKNRCRCYRKVTAGSTLARFGISAAMMPFGTL